VELLKAGTTAGVSASTLCLQLANNVTQLLAAGPGWFMLMSFSTLQR
jgi:hypothetical protein